MAAGDRVIKIISPNGGTTYTETVDFKGATHRRIIRPNNRGKPSPVAKHTSAQRPFGLETTITVMGTVISYTMQRALYLAARDWNTQLALNSFTQINIDYSDGTTDETFKGLVSNFNLEDQTAAKNAKFIFAITTGTDDT